MSKQANSPKPTSEEVGLGKIKYSALKQAPASKQRWRGYSQNAFI